MKAFCWRHCPEPKEGPSCATPPRPTPALPPCPTHRCCTRQRATRPLLPPATAPRRPSWAAASWRRRCAATRRPEGPTPLVCATWLRPPFMMPWGRAGGAGSSAAAGSGARRWLQGTPHARGARLCRHAGRAVHAQSSLSPALSHPPAGWRRPAGCAPEGHGSPAAASAGMGRPPRFEGRAVARTAM